MRIQCAIKAPVADRCGATEVKDTIFVTLEGEFEAMVALLRKLKFDTLLAKELELQ